MKVFVIAAVLAFVAAAVAQEGIKLTEAQHNKVRGIANDCIKQTGTNEAAVLNLRAGGFSAVDENAKCFAKCFQEHLGYLKNGSVDEDAVNKSLGPLAGEEKVKAVQAKCNGATGSNDCDAALERYKCYYGENMKILA
ncbi:general odorant-binding protein 56d-like [Anastrepha obliqua]|uniref:general odorant-binding protein 56d-like n=1 Tax=Anastrepha obliqua TaxID=95512 RepID=UPI0024096221|nr:general odorant-binding protein 56d-like [Anastrepha obliqua]